MPTEMPPPTPIPAEVLDIGSEKISLQGKMTMVYVPAGEFEMGSDWEDLLPFYNACKRENDGDWCERIGQDEKPKHTVYLDAYWIDKTEVTNAMYAEFLNEVGNQYLDNENYHRYLMGVYMIEEDDGVWEVVGGYEDHPVKSVAWQGALDYCHWAGRRLPTEAEWEKAARGTDGRTYPWGEEISCDYVNYKDCVRDTTPVGSYPEGASPYGCWTWGEMSLSGFQIREILDITNIHPWLILRALIMKIVGLKEVALGLPIQVIQLIFQSEPRPEYMAVDLWDSDAQLVRKLKAAPHFR
jgi:serine/threonine-protein kinase